MMKNAVWQYRALMLVSGLFTLVAAGGCRGLTDQQLSGVFQSVLTTGLTTLVNTLIASAVGAGT